jgi:hypothetical protein
MQRLARGGIAAAETNAHGALSKGRGLRHQGVCSHA